MRNNEEVLPEDNWIFGASLWEQDLWPQVIGGQFIDKFVEKRGAPDTREFARQVKKRRLDA